VEEKKLFGKICPKCGELCIESQIVKSHLGAGAQVNMMCPNNHKWTEFYQFTFTGYWWDGKMYDSYGEEKKKED